jgi:predicted nuclease of restriction endonuclease-like (RecB) superfamily
MNSQEKSVTSANASLSAEKQFFAEIAGLLSKGRRAAYTAVNLAMVKTYWEIGKRIVEREQNGNGRASYGDRLLIELSQYLGENFGKGFSVANLRNFRQFYLTFPENATQCAANLGWSHIRLIMRLDDEKARNYYLTESREQNWSVRVLERNIRSGYAERILSSQLQENTSTNAAVDKLNARDFIKDPYVLEFLNLPEDVEGKEQRLEAQIITHLQKFLLELGKGFSFVGRQFRISTETTHFYIDLVFYNYLLKCFIILDLKTGKLAHQDIGQMDMYVRMFDDLKRGEDDNPTLGIILCADKDETIVKYSVLQENRQIFASKYMLLLPTEEELAAEIEQNTRMLGGSRDE